jgi:hypothetical protein
MLSETKTSNKIRYRLVETPIKKDGRVCYAARAVVRPMGLAQIAEQMVREGSKYAEHEIVGIAEQMMDVIIYQLRSGYSVNFGSVMRFRPSIKGRFESKEDTFDLKEHQLRVAVSAGSRLRNALDGVAVECVDEVKMPEIRAVSVEHPGQLHLVEVTGRHLYQKHLGDGVSWWARVADKQHPIMDVVQKSSGRTVTFLLPQAIFPIGTEVTIVLKVGKNEFSSALITL